MDDFKKILKKYWGYDDFRGIQKEIIESIGAGYDTLGLMPTGGGKSITFQVPALAQEGVCIVITPLIALMKDQVYNLRQRGILASAIYSGLSHDNILQTLENAIFGGVKILYVSPERLASPLFTEKLRHMKVSFICVDEAHCISQWGYDFRPSYLSISDIRKELPEIPILCDPSHIGGKRELIAPISQQAMDLAFDGLIIESHCNPDKAWSDASQQITPEVLECILDTLVIRDEKQSTESLTQLRKQIDELDNDILETLAKRMRVCEEIGVYKKEHNLSVLQTARYDELLQDRIAQSLSLGLSEDFLKTLFVAIHEESVRHQMEIMNK